MRLPEPAVDRLRETVQLLVEHRYEEIPDAGHEVSAAWLAEAIAEDGRKLITPSERAYTEDPRLEVRREDEERVVRFHVDFPLWTAEDGPSDLRLQAVLTQVAGGNYGIALRNVRVRGYGEGAPA